MRLNPGQFRPIFAFASIICFALWVLLVHCARQGTPSIGLAPRDDSSNISIMDAIYNETLGFTLPERTDKRDALSLSSALTGFKITWQDGVKGETIPDTALPVGWNRKGGAKDTNLGSWRGHANAMRRIIDDNLPSALIVEDDLYRFALAARELQTEGSWLHEDPYLHKNNPNPVTQSPYGRHWDLLWLGSCQASFNADLPEDLSIPKDQQDNRQVLIENDDTVPSQKHRSGNNRFEWDAYPNNTRIVYVQGDHICTYAYALTQLGARRALEYMSLRGQHKNFDHHLSDLCHTMGNGMRCIGIVPSLFVHHRPRGLDIGYGTTVGAASPAFRETGSTNGILYSTRLNLQRLLRSEKPEMQWDD
ncbi:uncharacterized protein B0I36DRAFT_326249 [Microdochium trichocladiopsis]|uniref:Glycosyltransferase family 25 protein n=1 Tax=Microdochium trichocladiopsis TaxID=1682393 RepID=A0A9P8Y5J6_9PEZI|nr:uncharacterized protein B0I36DRAFT_326249 [Microdochium trichocladiopsis]KAH7029720.1 hypothetical protein B0I36DRAFT_326249 [Microdochium trichocladiopsis]